MRCASCKHRWFELGPEPDEAAAPTAFALEPEPDADAEPMPLAQPNDGTVAPPRPGGMPRYTVPPEPGEALAEPPVEPVADDEPPHGHPVLKTLLAILLGAAFSAGAAAMWIPASQLPQFDLGQVPWLDALVNPATTPPSPLTLRFSTDPQPVSGGRTLYAVTGVLDNPTATAQAVPPLEGRLEDAGGAVSYRWTIPAPAGVLLPGQQVAFDASALGGPGERVVIAH